MNEGNGDAFNEIGDEVTVPEVVGGKVSHEPKHGDDREREGKGDEERHLVVLVEFVNNHQHVDVAEGDETEGEDVQGAHTFGNHILLAGTEEPGDGLGHDPDGGTGNQHCNRNETERLGDDKSEGVVVPPTHLDGTERLDGTAGAGKEEIVDIKDVHTDGEGKDSRSSQGGEDNAVGTVEERGKTDRSQSQRGALGHNGFELRAES